MSPEAITINRAPVLTLWATVVAERMGYDPEAALTLGKQLAGLNAQSKGQRLGIYEPPSEEERVERARQRPPGETFTVELLGRAVPAVNTSQGLRAVDKDKPVDPQSVRRYLEKKFGDALPAARQAMQQLAASFAPEELARKAYALYEDFRPEIPEGKKGWGAAGVLNLDKLRRLARQAIEARGKAAPEDKGPRRGARRRAPS